MSRSEGRDVFDNSSTCADDDVPEYGRGKKNVVVEKAATADTANHIAANEVPRRNNILFSSSLAPETNLVCVRADGLYVCDCVWIYCLVLKTNLFHKLPAEAAIILLRTRPTLGQKRHRRNR